MKYGSYEVVYSNASYAIGYNNNTSIQPFVTWKLIKDDVTDAIFFDTYEDAYCELFVKSVEGKPWIIDHIILGFAS